MKTSAAVCLVLLVATPRIGFAQEAKQPPVSEVPPPATQPLIVPTPGSQAQGSQATTTAARDAWRRQMALTPFPKPGCFTSSYPSIQWQEVPCSTNPARPHNPYSDSAIVSGYPLSSATGSFDSVTGATAETDTKAGPNAFSLQLNSNGFGSPFCGSSNPQCAVQQFIYDSPGSVYIQYWLRQVKSCPSQTVGPPGNSWNFIAGVGCFINGNSVTPTTAQQITDLTNLRLTGSSSSSLQSAMLEAADGSMWGSPDDGDFLRIGTQWNQAEFNVFGLGNSSTANLSPNPGTTIVVRTSVDNGTTNAPSIGGPITLESNNLALAPPPCPIVGHPVADQLPALVFTESNTAGVTSMCACLGSAWDQISQTCWAPPRTPSDCTVIQACDGAVDGVCYDGLVLNQYDTGTRYLQRSPNGFTMWSGTGGLADTNPPYGHLTYYRICDDNPGYPAVCSSAIAYTPVATSCPNSGGGGGGGPGCYVNGIPVRCPRCGTGIDCKLQ
jgi:hypothetical protein